MTFTQWMNKSEMIWNISDREVTIAQSAWCARDPEIAAAIAAKEEMGRELDEIRRFLKPIGSILDAIKADRRDFDALKKENEEAYRCNKTFKDQFVEQQKTKEFLFKDRDALKARVEKLEEALKKISTLGQWTNTEAWEVARAALTPDAIGGKEEG